MSSSTKLLLASLGWVLLGVLMAVASRNLLVIVAYISGVAYMDLLMRYANYLTAQRSRK